MATIQDQVKITKNCPGCGRGTHLVQDSTGSMWIHDNGADEYKCWKANRSQYEDGTL